MKIHYVLLIFLSAENVLAQIGDFCTMDRTGRPGTCRSIWDCEIAKQQAQERIRFTTCGRADNSLPIICCEEQGEPGSERISSNERISEQKCKEYNKPTGRQGVLALVADAKPIVYNVTTCNYEGIPLIVGGTPAIPGEFPFMAVLGYNVNGKILWNCGATLISEKFVLTAAHCLWSHNFGSPVLVRLGAHDLTNPNGQGEDFGILKPTKHPDHLSKYVYNDIALLKLNRTVNFTPRIRPACLWNKNVIDASAAVATGWGLINPDDDEGSDKLLKVKLDLIPDSKCSETFESSEKMPSGLKDSMLCAGDLRERKDTCQGDSGGPLFITREGGQCTFYVIGVTSFGKHCATKKPAVYTRVSSFIEWIENTVW